MTQEMLNCLLGEPSAEQNKPSKLRTPPLAEEAEAPGSEASAREENDTVSASAGRLPPKEKAADVAQIPGGEDAEKRDGETRAEPRADRTEERTPDARRHLEELYAQAARIPGFDLREALQDPAFVRLTAPGVGVSVADAWYALHREEIRRQQEAESRAMLSRALAASAARPREGGDGSAALIAADYRSLSRDEQLRVKKRILEASARGEKLYP